MKGLLFLMTFLFRNTSTEPKQSMSLHVQTETATLLVSALAFISFAFFDSELLLSNKRQHF